ncbi:membrane protein [Spirochaetia bacterium]|nr:membrane protein [Spirochaetia bacterium]
MIAALLVFILVLSVYSLFSSDLLYGAIALSAVSMAATVVFYLCHAPDVAITEAAVGAGLSTLVYVWAIRVTDRSDRI